MSDLAIVLIIAGAAALFVGAVAVLCVIAMAKSRRDLEAAEQSRRVPSWYSTWHSPTKRYPGWDDGDQ
jgi:hypothetical protein